MRGTRPDAPYEPISYHYARSLVAGPGAEEATTSDMTFEERAERAGATCRSGATRALIDRRYAEAAVFYERRLAVLSEWDRWSADPKLDRSHEVELVIRCGQALRDAADRTAFAVLVRACLLAEGQRSHDEIEVLIDEFRRARSTDDEAYGPLLPGPDGSEIAFPRLLAEAALANTRGSLSVAGGGRAHLRSRWIERALEHEDDLSPAMTARLRARLSMEKLYLEDHDAGLARSKAVLDMVLPAGTEHSAPSTLGVDPEGIDIDPKSADREELRILNDLHDPLWRPDQTADRQRLIDRMDVLAERDGHPRWRWTVGSFGFQLASELGRLNDADERLAAMVDEVAELGQPRLVHWTRLRQAVRNAIRGELDESERLAAEGWQTATAAGDPDADLFCLGQLFTIHLHRDTLRKRPVVPIGGSAAAGATLDQLFAGAFQRLPQLPVLSAALVATYAIAGDAEQTRFWLQAWADGGARHVTATRRDQDQLSAVAALSIGAAFLRDDDVCSMLLPILEPRVSTFVDNGTSYHGSAAHYAALLRDAVGDWDESDRLFEFAISQNRGLPAPGFEGLSRVEWARSLADDRRPSNDMDLALDQLLEATRIASDHSQFALLNRRIEELEPRVMSA